MRIFFFHLMPYAALDPATETEHDSAWVTLPNSYFDPAIGAELYNNYMDQLEYADALGFDGIGVNEHHQTAYGLMPSPIVIASALARRTKTAKIAILGSALPLRNHPLTLAEEHAMIDVITRGRLISGFVRGIGAEYHTFGRNPTESHDRFHEAHDLIIQAWTQPGPTSFEGKYYDVRYVNLWPKPYQKPHPPIWVPSQGSRETIDWAAHPDRRYTYLQTFSPAAAVAKYLALYREVARGYGYEATDDKLGWAVPVYVGADDESARREAKPHIEAFRRRFLRMTNEMLLPPGYTSLASMRGIFAAKRQAILSDGNDMDGLIASGMFICGGPETVAAALARHHETMGFRQLLVMLQFGTLPHDMTMANLERFAKQVMPKLKPLGETRAAAA
jgi:alkanesulfonate monooxygenase SsuD/methylene tetrahydromethanopterin reductase-like flavin-dependent oxidoreductase (luciferase family)